jgi:hypothetical protein
VTQERKALGHIVDRHAFGEVRSRKLAFFMWHLASHPSSASPEKSKPAPQIHAYHSCRPVNERAKAEPGFFTPERVHLVEALAGPASVTIANARLFEEVRSGREQIKKVTRKLVEAQEGELLEPSTI